MSGEQTRQQEQLCQNPRGPRVHIIHNVRILGRAIRITVVRPGRHQVPHHQQKATDTEQLAAHVLPGIESVNVRVFSCSLKRIGYLPVANDLSVYKGHDHSLSNILQFSPWLSNNTLQQKEVLRRHEARLQIVGVHVVESDQGVGEDEG